MISDKRPNLRIHNRHVLALTKSPGCTQLLGCLSVLIVLMLPVSATAQITTHIDGYSEMAEEGTHRERLRPFIGTFDFVSLPGPLQEAEVDFTLTALQASSVDWEVSVWALDNDNRVNIVEDSVHLWSTPIEVGDEFRGTIRFVPLASGMTSLDVGLMSGGVECGLTFTWCLSVDGELLYLGNSEAEPRGRVDCSELTTFFFPADSIYMTTAPYSKKGSVFGSEVLVKPVPRVGDTSLVTFRLTANRNWLDGADFHITSSGLEVVSVPGPLREPIVEGQVLELAIGFVPRAISATETIDLQIFDDLSKPGKERRSQMFRAAFIFSDDGDLRYTSIYPMPSEAVSRVPTSFRQPDQTDSGRITVWKSGEIQRKGQVVHSTVVGPDARNGTR